MATTITRIATASKADLGVQLNRSDIEWILRTSGATAQAALVPAKQTYVIGSRSSELAMIQTRYVRKLMQARFPGCTFKITDQKAYGDKVLNQSLAVLAGANPGLFTKDLEVGLVDGRFDFIVHSLKDMPTTLPDGLLLAAITERAEPEDALVVNPKHKGVGGLAGLPTGAVIGTSSVRRAAIIRRTFPQFKVIDVRGNLQTRLKKLHNADGPYDALILATAGLRRLGWDQHVEAVLSEDSFPYGVGQGALGVECRAADVNVSAMLVAATQHLPSALRCRAERGFMRTLQGGCQVPIAVVSSVTGAGSSEGAELSIFGQVLSLDGKVCLEASFERKCFTCKDAENVGLALGQALLDKGARKVLGLGGSEARPLTYSTAAT